MIQRCCIFRIAGYLSSCCLIVLCAFMHFLFMVHSSVHCSSFIMRLFLFDFDGWESTTYYYYLHYIDTSR